MVSCRPFGGKKVGDREIVKIYNLKETKRSMKESYSGY